MFAVFLRPYLWGEAVRSMWKFSRAGWWKTWPPLPLPPADYLAFRVQTHNGGTGHDGGFAPDDLVAFLKWGRGNRHVLH